MKWPGILKRARKLKNPDGWFATYQDGIEYFFADVDDFKTHIQNEWVNNERLPVTAFHRVNGVLSTVFVERTRTVRFEL